MKNTRAMHVLCRAQLVHTQAAYSIVVCQQKLVGVDDAAIQLHTVHYANAQGLTLQLVYLCYFIFEAPFVQLEADQLPTPVQRFADRRQQTAFAACGLSFIGNADVGCIGHQLLRNIVHLVIFLL